MKELNLTVGQKVWSIQLGECEVVELLRASFLCSGEHGVTYDYLKNGKAYEQDHSPSLFESNPFTSTIQLPPTITTLSENKPENKADLILALFEIVKPSWESTKSFKEIAENKLRKLLESI